MAWTHRHSRGDVFPNERYTDRSIARVEELSATKTPFVENIAPT
jgi:hypothetical protein